MGKTIYRRGKIVKNKDTQVLGIFLKRHNNMSYVVELSEEGQPLSVALVESKLLVEPKEIPQPLKQIDIA